MPLNLKLLLAVGLLMTGCASSNGGAGCVVYLNNGFTVDPVNDTSATVAGIAELEAAMMGACE
jgi:hypothetical protein